MRAKFVDGLWVAALAACALDAWAEPVPSGSARVSTPTPASVSQPNWVPLPCTVSDGLYVAANTFRVEIPDRSKILFSDEHGGRSFITETQRIYPGQKRSFSPPVATAGCTAKLDGGKPDLVVSELRWSQDKKTAIAHLMNLNGFLNAPPSVVRFHASSRCSGSDAVARDSGAIALGPRETREVRVEIDGNQKPLLWAAADADDAVSEVAEGNNRNDSAEWTGKCR
ncbi:MAG TPA: hypothetical protein VHE30_18995 [Polyangiaceae bacterium]|nr:hypothetical protein [Polyangiaceae bacterium]